MQSDDELIQEYQDGDISALETLFKRYTKDVYRFVYRMTQNTENTEDITQDVFIKAWRRIDTYKPGNDFRSWLFSIARNTAIDLFRKRSALTFSDLGSGEGVSVVENTLADPEPPPNHLVDAAIRKKVLGGLLAKLPDIYREVLVLRYEQDLEFTEIASITGNPLETIRSRHRRALIQLRKLLTDNLAKDL